MAKKTTKKATKKVAKKATKKVAKKTTKKTTKKVAKKTTKKMAQKAKKKIKKKATQKATKKVATKTTKKSPAKKAVAKKPAPTLPAIGTMAPTFTLRDQDGNPVSLENFRGSNVLVYFYPRAMTPGCTVQACGLRDSSNDLAAQGIVVLGISPDEPASLKKFIEKDQLNFTLLSDSDNTVAKAYGSYGQKQFMGRTFDGILRQSFLVGKDGQLLHVISKVDTGTHAHDVLELFKKLA